jgi:hypothetical protein
MNMVIVGEIVVGFLVLVATVRFAVRDARQRRGVTESAGTGETTVRGDEREDEEVAALSASSTAPEPPAAAR